MLGQRQGVIRMDDDSNFMALVLLGLYGQAMLSALAADQFTEAVSYVVKRGSGEPP